MPRTGPRRPVVNLRLSEEGIQHVDDRALTEGLTKGDGEPNRSEMIRIMLAFAAAKMPQGWRPPTPKAPARPVVKAATTRKSPAKR